MADRDTAQLFAEFFDKLAENPDEWALQFASWMWPLRLRYDFCDEQMCCDDSLVKLKLAKRVPDESRKSGTRVIYKGDLEWHED